MANTLDFAPSADYTFPEPQRIAASPHGMIATQHPAATAAGAQMLAARGNAIDAAVTAALALGVCEPVASGLGGQSVLVVHLAQSQRTFVIDGASRAPQRAHAEVFSGRRLRRLRGHWATTIPSTPATLAYALEKYGTQTWAKALEPAIAIGQEGIRVTKLLNTLTHRELRHLRKRSAANVFLSAEKQPHPIGTLIRQPTLAATHERLASAGVEDFYHGEIAAKILADMQAHDALITADDFIQIPWPSEKSPVFCDFEQLRLASYGTPGAGRTLVEMLHLLEQLPPVLRTVDTPEGAVAMAEVIRQAFIDRRDRPSDPTLPPPIDEAVALSIEHAQRAAQDVLRRAELHGETTHLSVMDRWGNAVALTQSIERVYGSMVMTPELGFLYNNYLSAYELYDARHPYYLRPGAVPWGSIAPSIVFRDAAPWAVLGSPGSERITSSLVQVLLRLTRQSPLDAVCAPRLHCSLDGLVSLEASRMRTDIPIALSRNGFAIDVRDAWSFYLGCVQLVLREGGTFMGVADPRRDGDAAGPNCSS